MIPEIVFNYCACVDLLLCLGMSCPYFKLVNVCWGLLGIRVCGRTVEKTNLDKVQSLPLRSFQICIQCTLVERWMCIHFPSRTQHKVTLAAITKNPKLGNDLNRTEIYHTLKVQNGCSLLSGFSPPTVIEGLGPLLHCGSSLLTHGFQELCACLHQTMEEKRAWKVILGRLYEPGWNLAHIPVTCLG